MSTQASRRPAAIAEKEFVDVNGAKQGMFITRSDHPLPVLLYLHGGMPDYHGSGGRCRRRLRLRHFWYSEASQIHPLL